MKKIKLICVIFSMLLVLSLSSCSCEKQESARMFPDETEAISTPAPTIAPDLEEVLKTEEPSFSEEAGGTAAESGSEAVTAGSGDGEEAANVAEEKKELTPEEKEALTEGYNVLKKAVSPDGTHVAYVFKRKSTSTHTELYNLSVLKADEKLTGDHGNAFAIGYLFDIKWASNTSLLVSVKKADEVGLVQEAQVGSIDIFYGVIQ